MPETTDNFGVEDNVSVVLRDADGSLKHAEGVNGPDPNEWGADEDRPDPFAGQPGTGIPLGEWRDDLEEKSVDELRALARDYGITARSKGDLLDALRERAIGVTKGPGEQWETNQKGEYVNR